MAASLPAVGRRGRIRLPPRRIWCSPMWIWRSPAGVAGGSAPPLLLARGSRAGSYRRRLLPVGLGRAAAPDGRACRDALASVAPHPPRQVAFRAAPWRRSRASTRCALPWCRCTLPPMLLLAATAPICVPPGQVVSGAVAAGRRWSWPLSASAGWDRYHSPPRLRGRCRLRACPRRCPCWPPPRLALPWWRPLRWVDLAWRLFTGENHVWYSGPATMALVRHAPAGGVATEHLHPPLPAQPGDPSSRIGVFLATAAVPHVQFSAALGLGLDSW